MFNKKIITIGIVAVVVLAVAYFGNKAITTTPQSGALGKTEYKVVSLFDESDSQALISHEITHRQAIENQLNKYAKDGWEFTEVIIDYVEPSLILKK